MAEYISRSEAIAELRHRCYPCGEVIEVINGIHAADAVVVTRCKNCAHKERATVNEKGFLICQASGMEITLDDFCSYGEPKQNS